MGWLAHRIMCCCCRHDAVYQWPLWPSAIAALQDIWQPRAAASQVFWRQPARPAGRLGGGGGQLGAQATRWVEGGGV